MKKEISIVVGRVRVAGTLDATPECLTVFIESPFKNLKNSIRFSGSPVGDRRFACNGKLSKETVKRAEEILKGLYLAGVALRRDPEFITRLRRFVARFDEKASQIQQFRAEAVKKYDQGKLSIKARDAKLAELEHTEYQNVIGRGVVFRQYAEKLAELSGGKADIQSILEFSS